MPDVILPALNEAGAIDWVLGRMPPGLRAIVVDNGSTDGTADLAAGRGAIVVSEPCRGFGSACFAGLQTATDDVVCYPNHRQRGSGYEPNSTTSPKCDTSGAHPRPPETVGHIDRPQPDGSLESGSSAATTATAPRPGTDDRAPPDPSTATPPNPAAIPSQPPLASKITQQREGRYGETTVHELSIKVALGLLEVVFHMLDLFLERPHSLPFRSEVAFHVAVLVNAQCALLRRDQRQRVDLDLVIGSSVKKITGPALPFWMNRRTATLLNVCSIESKVAAAAATSCSATKSSVATSSASKSASRHASAVESALS